MDAQADLSLRWAHVSEGKISHDAVKVFELLNFLIIFSLSKYNFTSCRYVCNLDNCQTVLTRIRRCVLDLGQQFDQTCPNTLFSSLLCSFKVCFIICIPLQCFTDMVDDSYADQT